MMIDAQKLLPVYRDGLLNDTLPFWLEHSIDHEFGGYLHCLGRKGEIIDTDKSTWIQGRFAWMLATLYSTVEKKQEWLDLARHGVDFLRKYGFDQDGRMFFRLTREGQPLRKRRYLFSETFTCIAFAAYAKAAQDDKYASLAHDLFKRIIRYHTTPGLLEPKTVNREMKGLGMPMVLISTAQVLREMDDRMMYREWINRSIEEIKSDFMHEEFHAVMETVGPNGEFLDGFDGRLITPGHAIEAAWFILHEARLRDNDSDLLETGLKILDWSWDWGWDEEFGGIIYFRDVKNLPPNEYWHDMKFWWPQNEAIIATLLAYSLTGQEKYARRFQMVHDWAHQKFPDEKYGEWFGYLHRDGRISTPLKGNMWKGPFHLPRMQWYCWQLLESF